MGKKKGSFGKNSNHKRKHEDTLNEKDNKEKDLPHSKNKKKMKSYQKQKQHKNKNGNRNFKRKLLWIDRCTSNKPPKNHDEECIIKVLVSGVELSDNHTYTNDSNNKKKCEIDTASIQKETKQGNSDDEKGNASMKKETKKDKKDDTNDNPSQKKDTMHENGCEKSDEEGKGKINDEQTSNEGNTSKVQIVEEEDVTAKVPEKHTPKKEIVLTPTNVSASLLFKNPFVHLIRCKSANTKKVCSILEHIIYFYCTM